MPRTFILILMKNGCLMTYELFVIHYYILKKRIILIFIQNLFSDVFFGVDDFPNKNVVRLETTVRHVQEDHHPVPYLKVGTTYFLYAYIYLPYNDRPPIFQKRPSIT